VLAGAAAAFLSCTFESTAVGPDLARGQYEGIIGSALGAVGAAALRLEVCTASPML
jgi:hypothetical protein